MTTEELRAALQGAKHWRVICELLTEQNHKLLEDNRVLMEQMADQTRLVGRLWYTIAQLQRRELQRNAGQPQPPEACTADGLEFYSDPDRRIQ